MGMMKILLKIVLLPIYTALALLFWVSIFITGFTSYILYLVSGLCFLITMVSLGMGLTGSGEALEMLTGSLVIFLIPQIADWIVDRIAAVWYQLGEFLHS